ncbi:MAG: alpha/beta fold hydrolase [Gemmatimonadota bacterium]|nr:alpha/beta fold hydrolase [Gemmatimonadota bacterium]MDE3171476.1 alpha/beta fold hydrolase [Gemmatimonadota bacterium]
MTSSSRPTESPALADGSLPAPVGTKVGTFVPAWWVPGAHAQTLWGKLAGRGDLPRGTIEAWDTPDGDFVQIFRVAGPARSPRLLLLHGLEGGLDSHYARGIMQRAVGAGWSVDFLLFRGCGTEFNRAPRLYHSGETRDLDFVLRRVVAEHAGASIVLAGYSLGGNVLLKWLGEQGAVLPRAVRAAAAVSVPFDLSAGARYISHGFSRIYERHFLRTLRMKAARKLDQFPGLYDRGAAARASSIYEFDEMVTAPLHGFAGAEDYYARSSSIRVLSNITLPTLLLSAYDDPFLPPESLASAARIAAANPALTAAFSRRGGHVGFVAGAIPGVPHYYSEHRLMEFFGRHVGGDASAARV